MAGVVNINNIRFFLVETGHRIKFVELFLQKLEITKSPWEKFKKDSVAEIEIRITHSQDTYLKVIHDYLNECFPFLADEQTNELEYHLFEIFGLNRGSYD